MRIADLFRLSTRMFKSRPTRTWLTIFGISVGIGAVLFLVSLGYGLQNVILKKIVFNQAMLSLTVTTLTENVELNDPAVAELKRLPKVADAAELANYVGQAAFDGFNANVEFRAANSSFFAYAGIQPLFGGLYDGGAEKAVLVSEAVLKLLNVADPKEIIGQNLGFQVFVTRKSEEAEQNVEVLNFDPVYRVVGVVEDKQTAFVYFPLRELRARVTPESYEQVQLKVEKSEDLTAVKDAVIERGFQVSSLSEVIEQANKIFSVVQIVLGLFGAIALVVSSIGMFNTMTVTLLERTNEIGIMRALGARRKDVRNLFVAESVIIGFLGGVVGITMGMLGGKIFNGLINILAQRFGGVKTDLFFYPRTFLIGIIILSALIGFFSGIFPARRAAKMDPLDALRYK